VELAHARICKEEERRHSAQTIDVFGILLSRDRVSPI
jgi:hypothetical protein